jgi:cell wall-associated NlpC family hydrolase
MLRTACGAAVLGACIAMTAGRTDAAPAGGPAAITAGALPAGGPAAWGVPRPPRAVLKAAALVRAALGYLGRPYRWSGIGRGGFDCSGLVSRVFAAIGVALPHSSFDQYHAGMVVPVSLLGPGDLVFFRTYSRGASHVGIYLGGNRFIHASTLRGVVVSSMDDPYYRARYLGARRY